MKRLVIGTLLLAATLTGCGASDGDGDSAPTKLTVYAAASLKDTFTEIGQRFEAENDDIEVTFSFAGSSDLVAQLQAGAPADVLATADEKTMQTAIDDDLVTAVDRLGTNTLQIVTPPDDPAGIDSLADLTRPGVKVVLCAPAVPCGAASGKLQKAAGLTISPVSEEQSVTDVLGKVVTGEADAGLVYVTDVLAAGDTVRGVAVPEAAEVVNTYPIASLAASKAQRAAQRFVDYVTTGPGQDVLRAAGFGSR